MKLLFNFLLALLITASAANGQGILKGSRLWLYNNTDSSSVNSTTGIMRYDPVTGKYRFYNAVTGTWFSYPTVGGTPPGSAYEIPFTNAGATSLGYSAYQFQWDEARRSLIAGDDIVFSGASLTPAGGGYSLVNGQDIDISMDYSWSAIFGDVHRNNAIFNNGLMAGSSHTLAGGPIGSSAILGYQNSTAGAGLKIHNFIGGLQNSFSTTGTSSTNLIFGKSNAISTSSVLESALIGNRASITNVASNYNFISGDGTTFTGISGNSVQWGTFFGEASSITFTEASRLVNNPFIIGGYLNAINLNAGSGNVYSPFIIGTRNTISNSLAGNFVSPMVIGYRSTTEGDMSLVTGFRGHATADGIGSFVHGFTTTYDGSGTWTGTVEPTTAGGRGAVNISANSEAQTVGHGAYGDYSAILGGIDHDIPSTSPRSVILGGNAIKARASDPDEVYVPGLTIATAPANDDALTQILARDATTGEIKYRDASSLSGGGGGDFWPVTGSATQTGATSITTSGGQVMTFGDPEYSGGWALFDSPAGDFLAIRNVGMSLSGTDFTFSPGSGTYNFRANSSTGGNANQAALNVDLGFGDPLNLTEGDFWYDATNDVFKGYAGSSTVTFGGGGGSTETASNGLTKVGDDIQLGGAIQSNRTLTYNDPGDVTAGDVTNTIQLGNAGSFQFEALNVSSASGGNGIVFFDNQETQLTVNPNKFAQNYFNNTSGESQTIVNGSSGLALDAYDVNNSYAHFELSTPTSGTPEAQIFINNATTGENHTATFGQSNFEFIFQDVSFNDAAIYRQDATGFTFTNDVAGTAVDVKAKAGGSTTNARLGGVISADDQVGGTSGTTETALAGYLTPANLLSENGQSVTQKVFGTFAANANNKTLAVEYGGVEIFTTGALAFNGGSWSLEIEIVRTGATAQRCLVTFISSSSLLPVTTTYTATAETLTSSQLLSIRGTGGASNDIVKQFSRTVFHPN